MRLTDIKEIKRLFEMSGFSFSKSLGQNFLINPAVCPKIAELGGCKKGVCALEIGTGVGVLTRELAERCDKVVAVEIDRRLEPILKETLADYDNVEVVFADIMEIDAARLIEEKFGGSEAVVCANLPYYITSPVIMRVLESRLPVSAMTVMVQKEVADRMQTGPGSKDYGALSLAVQYYASPYLVANVPPNCFLPRPKVGSAVIRLTRYAEPPVQVQDPALMFRLIRASFSQRRKTLLNGLSHSAELSFEKEQIAAAIANLGLPPAVRGETLSLEQFARLCDTLLQKGNVSC